MWPTSIVGTTGQTRARNAGVMEIAMESARWNAGLAVPRKKPRSASTRGRAGAEPMASSAMSVPAKAQKPAELATEETPTYLFGVATAATASKLLTDLVSRPEKYHTGRVHREVIGTVG